MPRPPIELVCFDLGGVLIRLCNGWDDALRRAGIDRWGTDPNFAADGRFHEINHQFERGQIDAVVYGDRLGGLVGLGREQVLAVLGAWLVEPYRGLDELLDRLKTKRVQTACLSNTNPVHWQSMTRPGPLCLPLNRLHHRFASPFIGHRKPDAAIYQHVQDQTGFQAQRIVFFDDLPQNIDAARRLGWCAWRIDPHGDPMGQMTDHLRLHGVLP